MSDKPYVSPLKIHREQAANHLINIPRRKAVGAIPTGQEIRCIVGGVNEQPIEALFHPASRTVYPVRDTK
jgi:hypothetical protein